MIKKRFLFRIVQIAFGDCSFQNTFQVIRRDMKGNGVFVGGNPTTKSPVSSCCCWNGVASSQNARTGPYVAVSIEHPKISEILDHAGYMGRLVCCGVGWNLGIIQCFHRVETGVFVAYQVAHERFQFFHVELGHQVSSFGVCARSIGGVLGRVWQWFAPVKSAPVLTPENFTERFERVLWNAREHHLNTFKERDDA